MSCSTVWGSFALAEDVSTVLPPDLVGLETAYLQQSQTVSGVIGSLQTSTASSDGQSGRQTYHGGISYRGKGNFQFGANLLVFDDEPDQPIGGSLEDVTHLALGVDAKYQFLATNTLAAAAHFSVDGVYYSRGATLTTQSSVAPEDKHQFSAATLQFPVTVRLSDNFWATGSLGYSFIPEAHSTIESFGSRSFVEGGLIYRISDRLLTYASTKLVDRESRTALDVQNSNKRSSIYTLGGQFALTPQAALNFYVTNVFGPFGSAANTNFYPDINQPVFGATFTYTPSGKKVGNNATRFYDAATATNVSPRGGHDFLNADKVRIAGFVGAGGLDGFGLAFAPDPDILFEFNLEQYASGSSSSFRPDNQEDQRFAVGGRWRAFSEQYGHPFDLEFGVSAGRDIEKPSLGVLFADVRLLKKVGGTDLTLKALHASYADKKPIGAGFGISGSISKDFSVGAETVFTSEGEKIWKLNGEYQFDNLPFSLGLFAGNAIGRTGVGQLYSSSEIQIGASLSWETSLDLF